MSSIEGHRPGIVRPPQFGDDGSPTEQLVSGVVAERCVSCGAPLGADQRYCINCGERRGSARFTTTKVAASAGQISADAPPPRQSAPQSASSGPRWNAAATLLSALVALLLALGVGVLIGHDASSSKGQTIHVTQTVNGAAAAPSAAAAAPSSASSTATTPTGSGKHHGGKAKSAGAAKGKGGSSKASSGGSNAASKVVGSNKLPPATVTQGQTGHGPGFSKKGKFNGSFFGN